MRQRPRPRRRERQEHEPTNIRKLLTVKVDCVALTHNGLVRPNNEDSILCDGWVRNQPMGEPVPFSSGSDPSGIRVFALADGLGGHSSGDVASQFVLSRICAAIAESAEVSQLSLTQMLQGVHRALFEISGTVSSYRGMGATVAGLVICPGGTVYLFHVGDSRIYRREDRFFQLLTKDDRLESAGYGENAQDSHAQSSLLQCLGGVTEFSQIAPHVSRLDILESPETFLLCSDGVSDMISQDEMEESMSDSHETTVRTLFDRVRNAGARDNVSIILVEVSPSSRPQEIPVVPTSGTGLTEG
jgi:serine/threonine protein phosphatase PrpC